MATQVTSLLLLTHFLSLLFAQPLRNYTIGIKVSTLWYSGSGDTIYFQICNDNLQITNTSNVTQPCLRWYQIDSGMENRGEWYYFTYLNQDDIGTLTSMTLLSKENDQFCLSQVRIDGVTYDDEVVDCMEVSDTNPHYGISCAVIDVVFGTAPLATFEGDTYDGTACTDNYNLSSANIYAVSDVPIANGTRTYEMSLTVSNLFYSGTRDDLYLRLCVDSAGNECTQICDDYSNGGSNCEDDWFVFENGVNDRGNTYKGYWNTKDIGNALYADIVIFGADQFCLSRFSIDGIEANADAIPECISDDTKDGCGILNIDVANDAFTSTNIDLGCFGIQSNDTIVEVTDYIFEFKTGAAPFCGAEAAIFFIFCTVDGDYTNNKSCSSIYEIGGQMPDEETDYSFTIDISDNALFNTISDVYFVDMWAYDDEMWCLSDITINGLRESGGGTIAGMNADSTPATALNTPVSDGVYCNGVRVTMATNVWNEFDDGPVSANAVKKCRWNTLRDAKGTVLVSRASDNDTWLDWMSAGYNWVIVCVIVIVVVICCIVVCACFQHSTKKKREQIEDTNRPWHGGNSAFYG